MPKKRKKQAAAAAPAAARAAVRQEIAEEITALSAIYAEAFSLHEDGLGFQLGVVPHPGLQEDNHASLVLHVRYTAGYPAAPLQLELSDAAGLSDSDVAGLAAQLQVVCADCARQEAVCVFDLVEECQEFLRQRNAAAAAEAAAADGAGSVARQRSEPQSLWHEMQQRLQAEAAAREAEASCAPGLQGPSAVLGEDLFLFDGGLFAEEGEPSFALPNLSSPGAPGGKGKRSKAAGRPDVSPDPLHQLAASPRPLSFMDKAAALATRSPRTLKQGAAPGTTALQQRGGLKAAAVTAAAAGAAKAQPATAAGGPPQAQQPQQAQPPPPGDEAAAGQQAEHSTAPARQRSKQLLLLSHANSCSFSNLPLGLQQLLSSRDGGSGSNSNRSRQKHRHKQRQRQQQQQAQQQAPAGAGAGIVSGRAASLVFGDLDASTYRRLSSESNRSKGSDRARRGGAAGGAGAAAEAGEVFRSCLSDSEASSSSAGSSSSGSSDSGDEPEEEGVSLRSQLLLGHLLVLAAGGPAAAGDASTTGSDAASAAGTSSLSSAAGMLPPASLQLLASHLRRAGLLPRWVHWLLQQLPQHPELYDRAFKRLFAQEIQECCAAAEALPPQPSGAAPSQLLRLFWDRQAQTHAAGAAAAASAASAAMGAVVPAAARLGLPAAAAGQDGRVGPTSSNAAAAAVAAAGLAAAAAQQQVAAVVSRYRSDFQELQRLGQGGFGVVVAAINRLDGRKYAVKKIKLQPGGGSGSFSRILREVATLSRLQHPNIVRYFQAWTEQALEDDTDADVDLSEEGEWGALSSSGSSSSGSSSSGSSSSGSSSDSSSSSEDDESSATRGEASSSTLARTGTAAGVGASSVSRYNSAASDSSSSSSSSNGSSSRQSIGVFGEPSTSIPPQLPAPKLRAAGAAKPPRQAKVDGAAGAKGKAKHQASSSASRRRRGPGGVPSQVLYIQMEYCPRTLAQALEAGPLDEADAWLVLRGILAGLAHIHAQGAIHRDLKPANIFYDSKGDIKLGDFGLAKFQAAHARQGGPDADASGGGAGDGSPRMGGQQRTSSLGGAAVSAVAPSDVTGVCGTGFYISPEIANGWASYDDKVDLYSLGVVVFEMWHGFSTGMERAVLLRELREAGRLPPAWEAAHPQVARLIRWLMAPKPADRPSARQVLQSDLLPPRLEDEQLKDLLRSLPDNEVAYERVIESLFTISSGKEPAAAGLGVAGAPQRPGAAAGRALAALAPGGTAPGPDSLAGAGLLASQQGPLPLGELPGAPLDSHLEREEEVLRVVREVAGLHGAVQMASARLGLSHHGLPRDAARFLAPSGALVALRYETRHPLAAWFAQQAAAAAGGVAGGYGYGSGSALGGASVLEQGLRRFEVCRVQRAGRGGRGLPASYLTADVDFITPAAVAVGASGTGGRERLLAEAEVVKLVTQVLDALPELGSYEVRLGHTQVLSAVITGMALPPEVSPASVMTLLASAAAVSAAAHSGTADAGGAGLGGSSASGPASSGALAATGSSGAVSHGGAGPAGASTGDAGAAAGAGAGSSSLGGRVASWPAIRVGLDGLGLDSTPVSRCRQAVLQLPGPLFDQLPQLRSFLRELRPLLGSVGLSAALAAADELGVLAQLLVAWGVPAAQVLLEPLLTPQAEYFSGPLFQVLLQSPTSHGEGIIHTSAVAAGGRYDALLRSLWSPAAAALMPAPGAVGATINCEKLVKMLSALQRRQQRGLAATGSGGHGSVGGLLLEGGGRLPVAQADVLVVARGSDGMLQVRMALLCQLWGAGISAAMVPREAPSLAEQYAYADACGAKWLVILDDKTLGPSAQVRVKRWRRGAEDAPSGGSRGLRRGEDASLHVSDLPRFLQLGLSGAQDPGRGVGSAPGGGHAGASSGSFSAAASAAGLLLDGSMDGGEPSSLGATPESGGGREGRDGFGWRERDGTEGGGGRRERGEQQGGGRHRDRRR